MWIWWLCFNVIVFKSSSLDEWIASFINREEEKQFQFNCYDELNYAVAKYNHKISPNSPHKVVDLLPPDNNNCYYSFLVISSKYPCKS